jgi:hypothetical protein
MNIISIKEEIKNLWFDSTSFKLRIKIYFKNNT